MMKYRRIFNGTVALTVLVLTGSAAVAAVNLYRLVGSKALRHGASPYTLTLTEVVVQKDGTSKNAGTVTWAQKADGSHMVRIDEPNKIQRIIDFADGTRVTAMDQTAMKSTVPHAFGAIAAGVRDPASHCLSSLAGTPFVEGETIAGYETVGGYRTVRVSSGVSTRWFSLDHGCAMLKSSIAPPGKPALVKTISAFIPGEPSPALFDTAHFREVRPSELYGKCESCSESAKIRTVGQMQRLDAIYAAHQGDK